MLPIAIYTLTSPLHDEKAVEAATKEFLDSLNLEYDFRGSDYSDYGTHDLDLIYVRTGGTESVLLQVLGELRSKSNAPFYLLASDKSNSLAASMEILSFLNQHQIDGEILHGSAEYVHRRVTILSKVASARQYLNGSRLGVIGKPSDWLISSMVNREEVKNCLGIELVDVPMEELVSLIYESPSDIDAELTEKAPNEQIQRALHGATAIYHALKELVAKYNLHGLTIRCFDLLSAVHNTGCIALAKLNAEGIIAGCEGDIPAMLSMRIIQALTGVSGFQANPARINPETGEILFAHCTIPFNMVERYELDTHFESGIGVGIRGFMPNGPVTIFKTSGDLSRCFVAEGTLLYSQGEPNLCRTQQMIRLNNPEDAHYFLTHPIGNHHIIVPGHIKDLLKEL